METRRIVPGWVIMTISPLIVLGVIAVAMQPAWPYVARALERARFDGPNWALWRETTLAVQVHVVAALAALAIGLVIWTLPKGRGPHKALGWVWVAAMAVTAASSLLITGLNGNSYSFIHLLTGWTLISLPMAVFAVRRKNVLAHKRAMTGMFVGGLLFAGALTFIPGRFMFQFFFG
jgi:uncharacterized membrane protein